MKCKKTFFQYPTHSQLCSQGFILLLSSLYFQAELRRIMVMQQISHTHVHTHTPHSHLFDIFQGYQEPVMKTGIV